jgi:hypothetical protein
VFSVSIEAVFRAAVLCLLIYFFGGLAGERMCSAGCRTRGGGAGDTGQRRRHTPALPGARLVDNVLAHQVSCRATLKSCVLYSLFNFPSWFAISLLIILLQVSVFVRFSLGFKNSM